MVDETINIPVGCGSEISDMVLVFVFSSSTSFVVAALNIVVFVISSRVIVDVVLCSLVALDVSRIVN